MNRGGELVAVRVVMGLLSKGLFRERDLEANHISHNWLNEFPIKYLVRRHGHGVWGPADYEPSRYEFAQIKFPKAVFWGPSALWLQGAEIEEPETLWVALKNNARLPKTLGPSTYVIRTRNLERDVLEVRPERRKLKLRVHTVDRARAEISRANFPRLLERAADRSQFVLPRDASFLSPALPSRRWWQPVSVPVEGEWTVG